VSEVVRSNEWWTSSVRYNHIHTSNKSVDIINTSEVVRSNEFHHSLDLITSLVLMMSTLLLEVCM
jgi:hypothetical protein